MTRWFLALTLSLGCPALALADVPSPNQALCTPEAQQRDGSQCMACQYERSNEEQQAENCAAAIERGYTERCAFGGMWIRAVYCDREANFIEVGNGADSRPAPAGGTPTEEPSTEPAPAEPGPAEPAPAEPSSTEAPERTSTAAASAAESASNANESRTASGEESTFGCSVGHGGSEGAPLGLLLLAVIWLRQPRVARPHAP